MISKIIALLLFVSSTVMHSMEKPKTISAAKRMLAKDDAQTYIKPQCVTQFNFPTNTLMAAAIAKKSYNSVAADNYGNLMYWQSSVPQQIGAGISCNDLLFSADDAQIVSNQGSTIEIYDVAAQKVTQTLKGHTKNVLSLTYANKLLASGSCDRTIRIWDPASGKCLQMLSGHTDAVNRVQYNASEAQLASCSLDKTIKLWNLNGTCTNTITPERAPWTISYNHAGSQLACAAQGRIIIYDPTNGHIMHILTEEGKWIGDSNCNKTQEGALSLAYNHDDTVLAVGLTSGKIALANPNHDAEAESWQAFDGHEGTHRVIALEYSFDDEYLFSSSAGTQIKLWKFAQQNLPKPNEVVKNQALAKASEKGSYCLLQ